MNILKILHGIDKGGIFTCECAFMAYWKEHGVQVDAVIIGEGDAVASYRDLAEDVYMLPQLEETYGGNPVDILKGLVETRRYAGMEVPNLPLQKSYDAVVYRRPQFIHIGGMLGQRLNCPAWWHMPDVVSRTLGRRYYTWYVKKYGIIPVANSEYTRESLGSICKRVIYPGFDEERTGKREDTFREELEIPEHALVLGNASRIREEKAQDLLIEGLIDSGIMEHNVHCLIAGEPLNTEFAMQCQERAIGSGYHFHFLGRVDEMDRFYSSIDCYVNSRRDAEPFGISIAEAMGAGLPVIAYQKGGPSEMIENGVNGWLIEKPTAESYAEAFGEAYRRSNEWPAMGRRSEEASDRFRADRNAADFLSMMRDEPYDKR